MIREPNLHYLVWLWVIDKDKIFIISHRLYRMISILLRWIMIIQSMPILTNTTLTNSLSFFKQVSCFKSTGGVVTKPKSIGCSKQYFYEPPRRLKYFAHLR